MGPVAAVASSSAGGRFVAISEVVLSSRTRVAALPPGDPRGASDFSRARFSFRSGPGPAGPPHRPLPPKPRRPAPRDDPRRAPSAPSPSRELIPGELYQLQIVVWTSLTPPGKRSGGGFLQGVQRFAVLFKTVSAIHGVFAAAGSGRWPPPPPRPRPVEPRLVWDSNANGERFPEHIPELEWSPRGHYEGSRCIQGCPCCRSLAEDTPDCFICYNSVRTDLCLRDRRATMETLRGALLLHLSDVLRVVGYRRGQVSSAEREFSMFY